MPSRGSLIAVALLSCLVTSARADTVVIDASDYAIGTDLSALFPGLSMAQVTQRRVDGQLSPDYDPVYSPVLVGQHYHTDPLGLQAMGTSYMLDDWLRCYAGTGASACSGSWSVVELRFASPVDWVQINAAWFSDGPGMVAFDAAGNELARCLLPFGEAWGSCNGGSYSHFWPYSPDGNLTALTIGGQPGGISRIVFGGVVGASTVTQVSYSVPEASTLALGGMAFALAGLLETTRRWTRRRRR